MTQARAAPQVLRFGVFEVDLASGILRKENRRVNLQEQPFKILRILLERPGQLVTREELYRALWPAGTLVELDQGVNTAVKKLRVALGDSTENPRLIETIPRRGDCLIAPVEPAGGTGHRKELRRRLVCCLPASRLSVSRSSSGCLLPREAQAMPNSPPSRSPVIRVWSSTQASRPMAVRWSSNGDVTIQQFPRVATSSCLREGRPQSQA
jgi:DNA-binding winged helix-turn-helix (wHTH) protein